MVISGLVHSALLKGSSFRDCFISFPHHWKAFIQPALIATFTLESSNNCILVSWSGRTHDHEENAVEDFLYLSSRFMEANGFFEEEKVIIKQTLCPPPSLNVTMILNSMFEWHEILLNMDVAQDAFLSQIRVLKLNQMFPIWLEGGAVIFLKVKSILPKANMGLLQFNTLVEVLPPTENDVDPHVNLNPTSKTICDIKLNQRQRISSLLDCFTLLHLIYPNVGLTNTLLPCLKELSIGLKFVPYSLHFEKENIFSNLIHFHPSLIIVGKQHLKNSIFCDIKYFISTCGVKKKNNSKSSKESDIPNISCNDTMAVVLLWDTFKKSLPSNLLDPIIVNSVDLVLKHKSCIISLPLTRKMALTTDCIVFIKTLVGSKLNDTLEVDMSPLTFDSPSDIAVTELKLQFKKICAICPIIINDMTILNTSIKEKSSEMLITVRNKKPIYIDNKSVLLLSVNLITKPGDFKPQPWFHSFKEDKLSNKNLLIDDIIIEKLIHHVLHDLNLIGSYQHAVPPQFALLQGNNGCGRTFIVEHVLTVLSKSPYFVHCEIIRMKLLKGKKVDSIQKSLKIAINNAIDFQPSLIIIDDLDIICSAKLENDQERGVMNDYLSRMTCMVKNLLYQITENHQGWGNLFVTVVATCKSRDSINSLLSSIKGKDMFPKSFQISPLNCEQKYEFLKSVVQNYYESFLRQNNLHKNDHECHFDFNKSNSKVKFESLNLTDINNLGRRIFLEGQSRWTNELVSRHSSLYLQVDDTSELINMLRNSDSCYFNDEDLEKAFHGFVPLTNKVLKRPTKLSNKKEVGGLVKAKEALEEMVLWPSQYPNLFGKTTLALRTGILLYGPPGCGKTLLVNTFASDMNINFITIKGPELLSKYIGQSEKAVREVFQRAQNAKPSILFFDEFESIAPIRGHDSTGVTDRVVNQLLTQIDGVEGLTDVYVLAATSRPDLIDPALLRPGRLDKSIYCPIPSESERLEILQALSKELSFDKEIDFMDIALNTHDFTGADLQSLLSTAQVKAAQESVGNTLYKDIFDYESKGDIKERQESTESDEYVKVMTNGSRTEEELLVHEKPLNFVNDTDDIKAHYDSTNVKFNVEVVVMKRHIKDALAEIKPSISATEKIKYEALHQIFNNSEENKVFKLGFPGRRETLA